MTKEAVLDLKMQKVTLKEENQIKKREEARRLKVTCVDEARKRARRKVSEGRVRDLP